jgi:hypothetical protein
MEEEPATAAAAADEDVPAEEETLPEAEERPVTVEEDTLSEAEERPAQEQEAGPAAAPNNVQVRTWNLDTGIPIAPQVWDADTPQIGVGAVDDGVEIVNLEDSEPMPAPPRISLTKQRPRRQKMPAHRKKKCRLIIRFTEASSAQTAEAAEDEGRPCPSTGRHTERKPGASSARDPKSRGYRAEYSTAKLAIFTGKYGGSTDVSTTRPVRDQREEILALLGTAGSGQIFGMDRRTPNHRQRLSNTGI